MKIILKGFADDGDVTRAEQAIRQKLDKPNGALQFIRGLLMPDETGLIAVIDGTDEELGDGKAKCRLVDAVYEDISIIATTGRAAECRLAKGMTSRRRSAM